ncbi:MAG TPA: carboxypeptidase regulatory-like domain-containing protein [Terriglobales bacterium]|nr:carboxypeptidase regulatory-like domain-containing protein [Terriglobales bacterium]
MIPFPQRLGVRGRLALAFLLVCLAGRAAAQTIPEKRIPRQQAPQTAAIQGWVRDEQGHGIPGVKVTLKKISGAEALRSATDASGIFRLLDLKPAEYEVVCEAGGWEAYRSVPLRVSAGEVAMVAITLRASPGTGAPGAPWRGVGPAPSAPPEMAGAYRELPRADAAPAVVQPEPQPSDRDLYVQTPDRWDIEMPEWRRYAKPGEFPYVQSHWWDPFNRRKLKGDSPLFGQQTFFDFTASSNTFFDARRVPVPSDVSTANPGSYGFFGKGEQIFLSQTFRFSFDLFHGDAAYRPVDWRIRITPAVNVNYLHTEENGIVNVDVAKGTDRTDAHLGLQEAFFEYKLKDLSPNYDFVSVRAGIQQFSSDFRGFLFVEEQPGVRIFGNLRSNRIEYNLAYFDLLEKDTNSLLNRLQLRDQQVMIANTYLQDFIWKGYTTQFSFHYDKDNASVHYDENGFLVRPAAIGSVVSNGVLHPHNIRAYYLGWTSNGHIGRINVSHAFYQALGHDDFNAIAGKRVDINAQMAALELSLDKDWIRFRSSFFYASGDGNPRDGTARGFDAIADSPAFAGGIFSFWNKEDIRLTSTKIELTSQDSLLPSLRSSKFEGQANFVNPGLLLWNVGADFDLKPKLQTFANVNFLRFAHTQPLELLLFQQPIHAGIGGDYSVGVRYRPPLTDNMIVTSGISALTPWQGLREIYNGQVLFSVFANVKLKF